MSTETKVQPEAYDIRFPKSTLFKLRVVEATNETSKKGDRQHKLVLEIIESAPWELNGQKVDVNGLKLYSFSTLTEKALKFANKIRQAFGFEDLTTTMIPTADATEFKGQVCYAIVESEETPRINELTKEPVLDPYTQKPLVQSQNRITEWIMKPKGEQ